MLLNWWQDQQTTCQISYEHIGRIIKSQNRKGKCRKVFYLLTASALFISWSSGKTFTENLLLRRTWLFDCKMKIRREFLTLWLNMSVSCRRVVYWHRCCLIISTRSNSSLSSSWGRWEARQGRFKLHFIPLRVYSICIYSLKLFFLMSVNISLADCLVKKVKS